MQTGAGEDLGPLRRLCIVLGMFGSWQGCGGDRDLRGHHIPIALPCQPWWEPSWLRFLERNGCHPPLQGGQWSPWPGCCPGLRGHAHAALWLAGGQDPACWEALGPVPPEQNSGEKGTVLATFHGWVPCCGDELSRGQPERGALTSQATKSRLGSGAQALVRGRGDSAGTSP